MLSLSAIMKAKHAGDIFSNDSAKLKIEYKELSKKWHPDLNNNSDESNQAMAKINQMYEKALELIEEGKWERTNFVFLKTNDGRIFEFTYQSQFNFELGIMYVLDKAVIFCIEKQFASYYNNYKNVVNSIKYPNDSVKNDMERFFPKINLEFQTGSHFVMQVGKEDNIFSLIDIHRFYKNEVSDKHVAWILSRLYNLECLLDYNQLSHNALTIESLFICPEHHGIFLFGGWWFATKEKDKLSAVPRKVYNLIPYNSKTSATATREIDLEAIKLVARQLLGDEYGSRILSNKSISTPIKEWVLGKSTKSALTEYQQWNKTLDKAYGKRVFIVMDINKNNLYA